MAIIRAQNIDCIMIVTYITIIIEAILKGLYHVQIYTPDHRHGDNVTSFIRL